MAAPLLQTPYDQLPAKFAHKEADVEFRLQCFLTVKDAQGRVLLMRIQGVDGWCLPAETMRVNEAPEQAAVRVARSWLSTPVGMWLDRVLSFPATGPEDNRWYVIFVFAADAPSDLKATPDTEEMGFFALDAPPAPFAMAHRDVWTALQ